MLFIKLIEFSLILRVTILAVLRWGQAIEGTVKVNGRRYGIYF